MQGIIRGLAFAGKVLAVTTAAEVARWAWGRRSEAKKKAAKAKA